MGVRTLVGTADGTTPAAAMYCSTSGWMIGPIWESEDAPEQIEAFLDWLRGVEWLDNRAAIFGREVRSDDYRVGAGDGSDPRSWTDRGLELLLAFWRSRYLDDDGNLIETPATEGEPQL
jgi:hypothetical protein